MNRRPWIWSSGTSQRSGGRCGCGCATRGSANLVESVDICQSVFASFFVRTSLGQYDLESPDKLFRLLVTITRNKVAHQANHEHAARRDQRRINQGAGLADCPAPGNSPSRQLAARELVQEARTTNDGWRAAASRAARGRDWSGLRLPRSSAAGPMRSGSGCAGRGANQPESSVWTKGPMSDRSTAQPPAE